MKNSNIEWTDHTFNPWVGCEKVSAGCANCYAEEFMTRKSRWANCWGNPESSVRIRTSPANWRKPISWNREAAAAGRRDKVFCASLADVFESHPQIQQGAWRLDLWDLIERTPALDWLLLTKRPEAVLDYVPAMWSHGMWPANVWMGVTAENQEQADKRIPFLLKIPAPVRFLSVEPMIGAIDLQIRYGVGGWCFSKRNPENITPDCLRTLQSGGIDWVICGGESGKNARPMNPDWARSLRDQCIEAGVPFFFKQWGEWAEVRTIDPLVAEKHAKASYSYPDGDLMFKIGKKRTGCTLDGQQWKQFPEVER